MQFEKISEQNAWDAVESTTLTVRGGEQAPRLRDWLQAKNIDMDIAVFPCIGEFDTDIYSGTVIAGSRRAYEYFVDLTHPEDAALDDVTDTLGVKDPHHPKSDKKDLVTMALAFFDAQNG